MLGFLKPYDGKRTLVKCPCGRVMWLDASQEIWKIHGGHSSVKNPLVPCLGGSLWGLLKVKYGDLDKLTWGERFSRRFGL